MGWTVGPGRNSDEDGWVGGGFANLGIDEVAGYCLAVDEAVLATLDDDEPIVRFTVRRLSFAACKWYEIGDDLTRAYGFAVLETLYTAFEAANSAIL